MEDKERRANGSQYAALDQEAPEAEHCKEDLLPAEASDSASAIDESDQEENIGLLDESSVARTKRHCGAARRRSVFLDCALLGLVLIIALLATLVWSRHPDSQTATADRHRKYVLDPDWDSSAVPRVRKYHWTIKDVELRPDGVKRPMMTINGEFPGPMIECNEGDTLLVEVHNEAVNSTSIHWHGLYQNGTNFMDGTVGITQCPIPPGSSMQYRFGTDNQSGTYWYHAHMAMQSSDGLFGPLIIHPRNASLQQLEYASDRVIMVQDYYHDLTSALLPRYLAPDNENAEPVPDGGLINGMNKRDCNAIRGRDCDSSSAERAVLGLQANKKHRLRIINTGAFAEFQVKMDEHVFAVTEVDGTDVVPAYHHRLNIHPAQRYSIVVNTNITDRTSFWLRAKMVTACFAEENPNLEEEVRAIVQYTPASGKADAADQPSSTDWDDRVDMQCLDMNTTELQPVEKMTPPPPDTLIYLRANFEIGNWRLSRGFFNSSSWRPSLSSPTLHRLLTGHASNNASLLPPPTPSHHHPSKTNDDDDDDVVVGFDTGVELVHQTTGIQTLDVLVSNFDDGAHPLHLHGYKYFVLGSGHGYPPASLLSRYHGAALDTTTTTTTTTPSNPLRRDTASVEAFGWLLVRVVADNPGVWALHCHIGWHTEAGMLMQFATRVDDVGLSPGIRIPDEHLALCTADGLDKGAAPPDSTWFGDFGGGDFGGGGGAAAGVDVEVEVEVVSPVLGLDEAAGEAHAAEVAQALHGGEAVEHEAAVVFVRGAGVAEHEERPQERRDVRRGVALQDGELGDERGEGRLFAFGREEGHV
ncbi:multicopper oxidase [Diplodia corticola]|uniref:Multicopper oxidase n=1 Tax=Diplodia corticola TaxID=236234 RepID=A0A1J9R1V2_9PEZI|nr:multicopper oxidase [Diplodia corticola]OJD35382.1 multicopper oxidase [Diplodia corticola]